MLLLLLPGKNEELDFTVKRLLAEIEHPDITAVNCHRLQPGGGKPGIAKSSLHPETLHCYLEIEARNSSSSSNRNSVVVVAAATVVITAVGSAVVVLFLLKNSQYCTLVQFSLF